MQNGTSTRNGDVEEIGVFTKENGRAFGHFEAGAETEEDQVPFVALESMCRGSKDRLLMEYKADEDSLRFYFLEEKAVERAEHHGVAKPVDLTEPLIL